jgi:hypothetical protein
MNLDSKVVQGLLATVIKSLGINGPELLANLQQFQGWVVGAIKHHDSRLAALEVQGAELNRKLDAILTALEINVATGEQENGSNRNESANG